MKKPPQKTPGDDDSEKTHEEMRWAALSEEQKVAELQSIWDAHVINQRFHKYVIFPLCFAIGGLFGCCCVGSILTVPKLVKDKIEAVMKEKNAK